ncbi:MAG: hypothetical protein IT327_03415 [Anaerolineae bacterium]|nr:hypothetical protein [Anaerolineae bacterium]
MIQSVEDISGGKAHYRANDSLKPLEILRERWIETIYQAEEAVATQRMTLYIADQPLTRGRIEIYIMNEEGEGEEFRDSYIDENGSEVQEEWPIWWTDNQTETSAPCPSLPSTFAMRRCSPSPA